MGFNAGQAVEPIAYDFSSVGGPTGTTPEPSNDQMSEFWTSYATFIREQRERLESASNRLGAVNDPEHPDYIKDLTQAERRDRSREIEVEYEQSQKELKEHQRRQRAEMLAAVASNQPSYEDIYGLPSRVLDAYEAYMLDELSPKGQRRATNA